MNPWAPLDAAEKAALASIAGKITHPELGLPDELFAFALKVVGMTNVDLLTLDAQGRVLLAWRADAYAEGWHVPGGIIRGEESIERRIAEVARAELHAPVQADASPCAILQFRGQRGAFISLVYRCRLAAAPSAPVGEELARAEPGDLAWFAEMPAATLPSHEVYRGLLPGLRRGRAAEGLPMQTSIFTAQAGWRSSASDPAA